MISNALRAIPYLLPVYILALAFSPNITTAGIQNSFISNILLLAPLYGLARTGNTINLRSIWSYGGSYLGMVLFLLLIWLNLHLPAYYTLLVISMLTIRALATSRTWQGNAITVVFFFFLSFIGINGFGWEQLLGWRSLLFILPAIAYPLLYINGEKRKYTYLLFILSFGFLCLYFETYSYLWPLVLALIPRALLEHRKVNKDLTDMITGILVSAYLVYYLLFATHLWQAITGGL